MPIEIRELIIEGSLVRDEDRGEDSAKVLTEEDIEQIKGDIISTMNAEGGSIAPEPRRQLMDDILREVKKLMDDHWRR